MCSKQRVMISTNQSVPDVPAQAPPTARMLPEEPGAATTVLPCRRTDSQTSIASYVTLAIVLNIPTMEEAEPTPGSPVVSTVHIFGIDRPRM